MSGNKITTTATTETVETAQRHLSKGKRLSSLALRGEKALSSTEEAVLRMHHGISTSADAVLATNGITEEIMNQLREMELKAFEATGRIDDLADVPAKDGSNAATSRIVDRLSGKS